ncbi:MAG TPA: hypothetical protein VGM50_04200 [Gemmatimonadaceae bacterium]
MLQRRLRGLLAVVTGGFIVGATAGVALGLILLLSPGPKEITVHPQFPGAVVLLPALLLGVPGAIGPALRARWLSGSLDGLGQRLLSAVSWAQRLEPPVSPWPSATPDELFLKASICREPNEHSV